MENNTKFENNILEEKKEKIRKLPSYIVCDEESDRAGRQ